MGARLLDVGLIGIGAANIVAGFQDGGALGAAYAVVGTAMIAIYVLFGTCEVRK